MVIFMSLHRIEHFLVYLLPKDLSLSCGSRYLICCEKANHFRSIGKLYRIKKISLWFRAKKNYVLKQVWVARVIIRRLLQVILPNKIGTSMNNQDFRIHVGLRFDIKCYSKVLIARKPKKIFSDNIRTGRYF